MAQDDNAAARLASVLAMEEACKAIDRAFEAATPILAAYPGEFKHLTDAKDAIVCVMSWLDPENVG